MCIVQYRQLRVRKMVARRSSGGMVWENRLVEDGVSRRCWYFQMELAEVKNEDASKAGISVEWNIFGTHSRMYITVNINLRMDVTVNKKESKKKEEKTHPRLGRHAIPRHSRCLFSVFCRFLVS